MALTRRYHPEHAPGDVIAYGVDLSMDIPGGEAIATASLTMMSNTNPANAAPEWTVGTITHTGRRAFAVLSGGNAASDYQVRWTITDTAGNIWNRTGLILVAETA